MLLDHWLEAGQLEGVASAELRDDSSNPNRLEWDERSECRRVFRRDIPIHYHVADFAADLETLAPLRWLSHRFQSFRVIMRWSPPKAHTP